VWLQFRQTRALAALLLASLPPTCLPAPPPSAAAPRRHVRHVPTAAALLPTRSTPHAPHVLWRRVPYPGLAREKGRCCMSMIDEGWGSPRVKRLHGQTSLHYFRNGRSLCPRRYEHGRLYESIAAALGDPTRVLSPTSILMHTCAVCRKRREREVRS
jgi:hypothetical protein